MPRIANRPLRILPTLALTIILEVGPLAEKLTSFIDAAAFVASRRASSGLKRLLAAALRVQLRRLGASYYMPINLCALTKVPADTLRWADRARSAVEAAWRLDTYRATIDAAIGSKRALRASLAAWLRDHLRYRESFVATYLECFDDQHRPLSCVDGAMRADRHYLYFMMLFASARHLATWEYLLLQRPCFDGWSERLRPGAVYTLPRPNAQQGQQCWNHGTGFCLTRWPPRYMEFQRHLDEEAATRQVCDSYQGKPYCLGCTAYWD
jgi:hypothetical protein